MTKWGNLAKKRKQDNKPKDGEGPLPLRLQRGDMVRLSVTIQDSKGDIGSPYKLLGGLDSMHKAGTLNKDHMAAAVRFREDFDRAHYPDARAAPLDRIPGPTRTNDPIKRDKARRRIWGALETLGGMDSTAGSCCWHVVGMGQSLAWWRSQSGLPSANVRKNVDTGVLIAVLDTLAGYYGIVRLK